MLAVITEVTVKLIPKPQIARCIMASFDDIRKAGDAVAQIIAAGIIPAGLEMMDKPMTAAVEDFVHAGYDLQAEAILLCESDGTPEEVDEEINRMLDVLSGSGAARMEVSKDEAQRLKFWSGRKNAFPASGRISPDYMCMDSTIPRKRLADILLAIQAMETKYGLRCANVFHVVRTPPASCPIGVTSPPSSTCSSSACRPSRWPRRSSCTCAPSRTRRASSPRTCSVAPSTCASRRPYRARSTEASTGSGSTTRSPRPTSSSASSS
jgi:FAD/FMN-containing dehydrogenase